MLMFCSVGATTEGTLVLGRPDAAKHKQYFRKNTFRKSHYSEPLQILVENLMLLGVKSTQKAHSSIKVNSDLSFKAEMVTFREANHRNDESEWKFINLRWELATQMKTTFLWKST